MFPEVIETDINLKVFKSSTRFKGLLIQCDVKSIFVLLFGGNHFTLVVKNLLCCFAGRSAQSKKVLFFLPKIGCLMQSFKRLRTPVIGSPLENKGQYIVAGQK